MSSDDPVHRLKDKILSSNENVNPKAVLVSVGINSALSVRFHHYAALYPTLVQHAFRLTLGLEF